MLSRKIILSAIVAAFALAPSIASAATNLITNGDFNNGFDGSFSTGYNVIPIPAGANSLVQEGNITIASDPHAVHNLWVSVPGSNPMLIANGAPDSTKNIWETSVAVTAGGKYNFNASVMDVCCQSFFANNAASQITFEASTDNFVTWTVLGSYTTLPNTDAGVLNPITGVYDATSTGSIKLRAVNSVDAASGNDFALDNLSFASAVPEPGTWAMLFLGFGAIGLMMRRRQSRGLALAA